MKKVAKLTDDERLLFGRIRAGYGPIFNSYRRGFNVNEGLIRTYPIEDTLRYLSNEMNIPRRLLSIEKSVNGKTDKIIFLCPIDAASENFVKNFKDALSLCGYFISYLDDSMYDEFIKVEIEPKYADQSNEYVRSLGKLYHLTYKKNISRILRQGLTPRNANEVFSYPDRVYCMGGDTDRMKLTRIAQIFDDNKDVDDEYWCLVLDVSKILKGISWFLDPNLPNGVYTYNSITPKAISDYYLLYSEEMRK